MGNDTKIVSILKAHISSMYSYTSFLKKIFKKVDVFIEYLECEE